MVTCDDWGYIIGLRMRPGYRNDARQRPQGVVMVQVGKEAPRGGVLCGRGVFWEENSDALANRDDTTKHSKKKTRI